MSKDSMAAEYAFQAYEMVENLVGADRLLTFDGELAGIIIRGYFQSIQQ